MHDSLRTLFHVGSFTGLTDGQLLERFALRDGEVAELAFAALVDRHGGIVLSTCRSILRDDHEARDAFQATFLVLVRKAGSLWVRDSLGPWLHRVAYRAAAHARRDSERRRRAEREAAEQASRRIAEHACDDLASVVHEEVDRLPDRYRIPVVLCDLEGRTYEEAARHLGCPVGTIKSRLARARECLRNRLMRRGVAGSTGPLVAGYSRATAGASLPAGLLRDTSRLAIGTAATAPAPASVTILVEEALRAMIMRKLVAVASVILVLSAVSMRVGSLWATGGEPQSNPPNTVHEQAKVADSGTDPEEILGTWIRVSTDGRKDDKIVKMEVKKDPDALRDDVPAGAARFLFEWKTEGEVGSRNRVLLNPTEDPRAIDFFSESRRWHTQGLPRYLRVGGRHSHDLLQGH